jgi:predicted dehydrogenase
MKRLALVGYGRIAPKHLEVFRKLGCEFVACCNRSEAGRNRSKAEAGISNTYAHIPEMLDREKPDGVICCVSLDQIYHAAKQIIPFGIPTLLEKPPGTSLVEWEELCNLANHHGTQVMVGLNRIHYSVLQRAIDDAGGIDRITAVFVEWSEDPQHCLNRGLTHSQVERMIFGNSLHGLHLLTMLAGELPEPQIVTRVLGAPFRWLMSLQGLSSRGALASFNSTWDSPGGWRLSFCIPGRRYVFAPLESCQVFIAGEKQPRTIEPEHFDQKFKPGFYRQAEAFCRLPHTVDRERSSQLEQCGSAMKLADVLTGSLLKAMTSRSYATSHAVLS